MHFDRMCPEYTVDLRTHKVIASTSYVVEILLRSTGHRSDCLRSDCLPNRTLKNQHGENRTTTFVSLQQRFLRSSWSQVNSVEIPMVCLPGWPLAAFRYFYGRYSWLACLTECDSCGRSLWVLNVHVHWAKVCICASPRSASICLPSPRCV